MSHSIVNLPPPSRYEHHYLPNNIGEESYLPVYSRRVRSPYQPIPLPLPLPGQRDRIIAIDYNQVARDAEEFRRRGYVPLPELPPDWVDFIAQHLYGKSNNFVRAFMKRYIIADTLITRDHEARLRRYVLDILRRVPTRESPEEARQFLRDMWETHISLDASDPDTYELLVLFIDTEALHRMFENGVEYNQSGRVKTSPRRASRASRERGISVRSSRRVRGRVSPGNSNSPLIYNGGKRRGVRRGHTHKYRTTRKSKHGGRDGYRRHDHDPHHQQPLLPEVWMRECTDGNWEELSKVKNVQNDVAEIERAINGVRGGFITPSSNPHSVRLPSGRYLRFNWKGDPSVHANIITNIKYIGKHVTCKLEKRRPKKGIFTDEFTNHG
jgi:hypothetical protein